MANKIIHKHSNVVNTTKVGDTETKTAKLPTTEQLSYGEIAVNYAKGYETISFKNYQDGSDDEIVEFKPKKYIDEQDQYVLDTVAANFDALEQEVSKYTPGISDGTIKMPNAVGGINSGTTVSDLSGKTINAILDDLLFPTLNPTSHTNPSVTLTLDSTTSPVALNSSAHTVSSVTFNKGKWNEYDNTIEYAGSAKTITYEIKINGNTYTTTNSLPSTYTKVGNQTYKVTVNYDKGPNPKNNKGQEVPSLAAPASSVTATTTINVTRPYEVRLTSGTGLTTKLSSCSVSGNKATISIGKIGTIPASSVLNGGVVFKVPGTLTKLEVDDAFSSTKVSSLLDSLLGTTGSDGYTTYVYKDGLSKGEVTINNGKIEFTA